MRSARRLYEAHVVHAYQACIEVAPSRAFAEHFVGEVRVESRQLGVANLSKDYAPSRRRNGDLTVDSLPPMTESPDLVDCLPSAVLPDLQLQRTSSVRPRRQALPVCGACCVVQDAIQEDICMMSLVGFKVLLEKTCKDGSAYQSEGSTYPVIQNEEDRAVAQFQPLKLFGIRSQLVHFERELSKRK